MAITWQGNLCKFDLSYWVIRDGKMWGESLNGAIQFDLACQRLKDDENKSNFGEISSILKKRCPRLLTNLSKKHGLSQSEVLNVICYAFESVNISTIETDDERDQRMIEQQRKNMTFFDKYSDEL